MTTSVTSLSNSLRGTEDWDAYLVVNGSPGGRSASRSPPASLPTLLTGLVAGLGLGGLLTRRMPERRFLICAVLAGSLIISPATSAAWESAGSARRPAHQRPAGSVAQPAEVRPLIRLPLALGLAHVLRRGPGPLAEAAAALLAAAALALVALPATVTGFSQAGRSADPFVLDKRRGLADRARGPSGGAGVAGGAVRRVHLGQPRWTTCWRRCLPATGRANLSRRLGRERAAAQRHRAAVGRGPGVGRADPAAGPDGREIRRGPQRPDPFDLYGTWPARIHDALATRPGLTNVASSGRTVGDKSAGRRGHQRLRALPAGADLPGRTAQPVASVVQPGGRTRCGSTARPSRC